MAAPGVTVRAAGPVQARLSWGPALRLGLAPQPVVAATAVGVGAQALTVRPVVSIASPYGVVTGTVGALAVPVGSNSTRRFGET